MSRNGYTRTWIGSRPPMQAWRHSGGPVIQLLLNSRRMSTFARHSVHLVIYCVFRAVVMTTSMIAGPRIIVLTFVTSVTGILMVTGRSADSGMSHPVTILSQFGLINSFTARDIQDDMCMLRIPLCGVTILTLHRCAVEVHLCGEACKLSGKKGCLGGCTKVRIHLYLPLALNNPPPDF